jgi:hypothetical protein
MPKKPKPKIPKHPQITTPGLIQQQFNVVASVARSTNQAIPDHTPTAISFNVVLFQTSKLSPGAGIVWKSSHPTRLTIPTGMGGLYLVGYVLAWDGSGAGLLRLAEIRRNGNKTPVYGQSAVPLNGALLGTTLTGCALLELATADYVELFGEHAENPANSLNAVGGATTLNLWLVRIT